jgi:hypothetical protein
MVDEVAPMKRSVVPELLVKGVLSRISEKVRCDQGGAIVEFVALALPLFIPVFIYLSHYALISDQESVLRTLAREMSRAVVTSENDVVAERVAEEVFFRGGEALGLGEMISKGVLRFTIECTERPCISPDNEIVISIFSKALNRKVSAVEYVSPWA